MKNYYLQITKSGQLVTYDHITEEKWVNIRESGPRQLLGVAVASSWHDAVELTHESIEKAKGQWQELTGGKYGEGKLWFLGHST